MIKRIPIAFEKVNNSDISSASSLTPPNKTNYQDISARIHVDVAADFTDKTKALKYGFGHDTLSAAKGCTLSEGDVLELENYEQITAFEFITLEDGKNATCQVEYFHNMDR